MWGGPNRLPRVHSIYDSDKPENIRSIIAWLIGFLTFGYIALNAFVPNGDMNIGIDVLLTVMALSALSYYIAAALRAIISGSRVYIDFLIVAISLSWLSQGGQAALRVITRLSGFDPAFVNNELFGVFKLMSVIAAVLHILPRGAADGVVPKSNTATVLGSFLFAAVLAVTVVVTKPDPKPLIDRSLPWIGDWFRSGEIRVPHPLTDVG